MLLTLHQVARACGASESRAAAHVEPLNLAMAAFSIDTPVRAGMFLANIGHETMGLRYLTEIWGPTPQQRRYERDFTAPWPATRAEAQLDAFRVNRLAFNLGNHTAGDGALFPGHGYLQNTGRFNHAKARDRLRDRFPTAEVPDFEVDPARLADPYWAALAAGEYAERFDLNAAADAGDFDRYCDLINRGRHTAAEGDSNGWAHRLQLWTGIGFGEALA